MEIRELPIIEPSDFNQTAPHPLQDFAWGTIRETTGLKVIRFGVYQKEVLIETYQMTLHAIPLLKYTIGYIPRSKMPSEAFLKYLKEYCRKYKIIFVMFEPDEICNAGAVCVNSPSCGTAHNKPQKSRANFPRKENSHTPPLLCASPSPLFYKWSRVIDLTKSVETLKKELEANTRYNIGLAERKGIVVINDDTDQGFEDFYSVYSGTTKRQHFGGHTKKYHKTIWDIFSKTGIAHILVAKYQEKVLCACELFHYKGVLYYTYAGSSTEHRNLKAMNALMWNVILFGKEHNATKLDLWGILPPDVTDPKNPWAGFSDFKKGYGGEAIEMIGSYDLVAFPLLYGLYQIAFKVRKALQALR